MFGVSATTKPTPKKSTVRKPPSERTIDAVRKRNKRADDKDVVIPPCADPERRELLESDDEEWLMYYFGPDSHCSDPYTYSFTDQQKEMLAAIRNAILHGTDAALAASRGEGKTTNFERMVLKYALSGVVDFAVLFASTGTLAEASLDSIKMAIEENDLLLADYPEVCVPVRALQNTPQRAHFMTVTGRRHDNGEPYHRHPAKFTWCGQEIIFPNVPGSPSARFIIATRGLDAAVRGLKRKGRRPKLAGIDDPDTEETAVSAEQAKKLEKRIDRAIAGLGGQTKRIARVMLTTLQSATSVSYKYTDPALKPSWRGRRFRFLIQKPERTDKWDQYVMLKQADWRNGTNLAHEMYLAEREIMDAGAIVANPNRHTEEEASALEFYYSEVARIGQEAVDTEYDNNPPKEESEISSGLTIHRIQRQVNGFERRVVPDGCVLLTQGIDIHKFVLYWVVRAWFPNATGFTIDYGTKTVTGTKFRSNDGIEHYVRMALLSRWEEFEATEYRTVSGKLMTESFSLADAGYQTGAVHLACAEIGNTRIMPAMGFGRSKGCTQANFNPPSKSGRTAKVGGVGWFRSKSEHGWYIAADADHWKRWEHARWLTTPGNAGSMTLFGEPGPGERMSFDEMEHKTYAKHILGEEEVEEIVRGSMRKKWKERGENHYLDASYLSDLAACMKGIHLLPGKNIPLAPQPPAGGWFAAQGASNARKRAS